MILWVVNDGNEESPDVILFHEIDVDPVRVEVIWQIRQPGQRREVRQWLERSIESGEFGLTVESLREQGDRIVVMAHATVSAILKGH